MPIATAGATAMATGNQHFWLPVGLQGLFEPDARKAGKSGSEGGAAQRCAAPTGQVETAYYGLKVTALGSGPVLRSHHPRDVFQELLGLFIVFQAARRTSAQTATAVGLDPGRISLTVTLRTARHTVINADLAPRAEVGTTPRITAAILNPRALGPKQRRPRILPRRVKRSQSKFAYNETRNDKALQRATITITVTPCPSP
ncbi:hypothetical protein ACFVVA_08165 [Kitasatospora sp. NPDC058048]|uniref:hypothetical protein n=1 Tax=Kitasatospora sp. NPDC058048 TaxID=3346313 RepID=UPI0036D97532